MCQLPSYMCRSPSSPSCSTLFCWPPWPWHSILVCACRQWQACSNRRLQLIWQLAGGNSGLRQRRIQVLLPTPGWLSWRGSCRPKAMKLTSCACRPSSRDRSAHSLTLSEVILFHSASRFQHCEPFCGLCSVCAAAAFVTATLSRTSHSLPPPLFPQPHSFHIPAALFNPPAP